MKSSRDHRLGRAGQKGMALPGVLLLMLALMALGAFGTRSAQTEMQIATNHWEANNALAAADAGFAHAATMLDGANVGFAAELSAGGTGGVLTSIGTLTALDGANVRFHAAGPGVTDGYYVRLLDNFDEQANAPATDSDGRVRILAVGRSGAATRTVRGTVRQQQGPECAIVADADIDIPGSPSLGGGNGCTHSNGDLDAPGGPILSAGANSGGTMTISGTPTMEGQTLSTPTERDEYAAAHSARDEIEVPSIRPLAFGSGALDLAAQVNALGGFLLGSDCRVYDNSSAWGCTQSPLDCSGGTEVADLSGGGTWSGWTCAADFATTPPARWSIATAAAADGAYFAEGWVDVSGSPVDWDVTLVSLNSIDITGAPTLEPFATAGELRNVILVSGNDIGLGGTVGSVALPGAVFAHQQVKNNGNPTLNGFLVAECGKTTWAGDPAPNPLAGRDLHSGGTCYDVTGNMLGTYSGFDTSLYGRRIETVTWLQPLNF